MLLAVPSLDKRCSQGVHDGPWAVYWVVAEGNRDLDTVGHVVGAIRSEHGKRPPKYAFHTANLHICTVSTWKVE